jgi:hypothetical protein
MSKYNFNTQLGTQNYTIQLDVAKKYGCFEHDRLGDQSGGGLWFDKNLMLEDYDGVFELPSEVKNILVMFGMCDKDF